MSLAEVTGFDDTPSRAGEMAPPQDLVAEQSVLGAMLMSKDAIADVIEVVRGVDFYRPAHELIYDAVLDLYGRGEPADAITVSAELTRRGEIGRIGGHVYLHDLIATVGIAANAGFYASIVREKAILRRLVDASRRIAQLGYAGTGDVDTLVDQAQEAVYSVTDRRTSEDYQPLSALMEATLDEIESIQASGGVMNGVPTGFAELDDLTNGLHGGQMVIVAARPAMGKALALDTPLPTPSGWTTMGDVAVGDELIDASGQPTRVVAATEVMTERPCYRITFSDGTSVIADAQHQWRVSSRATSELVSVGGDQSDDRVRADGPAILTTEQLAVDLRDDNRRAGWFVELPEPSDRRARDRVIPAHLLGASGRRYVTAVEPVDSVPVRCVEVDNPEHLYLATRSLIPTHNSTLGLDFVRAASITNGLCSVFFSLEMSQTEITMKLLSAEADIPLTHIRKGQMSDDDWNRLSRKMGQVSEAPLFIDDSPNLTMMEIRAKARRLKQRHDLKLVIIDYLQLMTSGKKVESRQLEVSEFSRQIKLLAKELDIPVVALCQLNRGPEQRNDKKPMVADLRESGCLIAESRVLRADTGAEVTLGELLATGEQLVPVWSVDDRGRMVARAMTHAFPSGTKEAFRMTLASGRTITATANHPFRTVDGWSPLGDLVAGSRIAIPRRVPAPLQPVTWDRDELLLLAHLIGDGSCLKRRPLRYASIDEANLAAVAEAAGRRFGITAVRDEYEAARVTTLRLPAPVRCTHGGRNPMNEWLDSLGIFGHRSSEKFVPARVFSGSNEDVAFFLRHLWATDGSVRWDDVAGMGRIYYATTSRRLADDVAQLLLRFGIVARINTGYRDGYHVMVVGSEHQRIFCRDLGAHGARSAQVEQVRNHLAAITANTNLDTIPREIWARVRGDLTELGMTHREFAAAMGTQFCGSTLWRHSPSRARLSTVATVVRDAQLTDLATSDLSWDSVIGIESIGERPVYDATVLGTHNFIADGIVVHNSLEQDADMVILLHREDYYDANSERPGEADLIVAKHRNGPTKTIPVAFQGHYSRFRDMGP